MVSKVDQQKQGTAVPTQYPQKPKALLAHKTERPVQFMCFYLDWIHNLHVLKRG